LLSSVVFVAVTGAVPWQLGSYVWPILHWWFCRCCTGVIARVALSSLQALHCQCWRCTGFVTNIALASLPSLLWHRSHLCKLATAHPRHSHNTSVCVASMSWSSSLPVASLAYLALFHGPFASDGPAEAALVSLPALCLRPWLHCIALLLLPVLRWHHFPCRVGAFVLIALALLPSLPLRCCQHREVASSQAQSSCNTCWCHCQYRALVVADVAPAPSPLLRRCLCPGCAGVAALGTPASPPASQTGIYPFMMQLQPVVGKVLLSYSTLSPVALSLYPELAHSDFCLRRSGQGSNGILLALSRCPCSHCTGIIASVKLFLLLVLRRCCCRVALQGPAGAAQAFAGIALAFCPYPAGVIASIVLLSMSPALCRHHRLVAWALLPLSRRHLCPHCLCLASSIATLHLPRHKTVTACAGVIASTAPLLLLAIVGIVALVPRAFLPL
jgi:hypothetical protein